MLLQITTTHEPARDLGFLVGKHPDRLQTFPLSQGAVHVFFPEASDHKTTVALLMELDPIHLVRGAEWGGTGALSQYVNDRPYVTSSYFSVAIGSVFREALKGTSRDRQKLADTAIDLEASVDVVSLSHTDRAHTFFEPLGWDVETEGFLLDPEFPEWGPAPYARLKLRGKARLSELLSHLYVLLPALDGSKHYYIDDDEVEKLMRHAEVWLAEHPARDAITRAYLERRRHLVTKAEAELAKRVQQTDDADLLAAQDEHEEVAIDRPLRLHDVRLAKVRELLEQSGARTVLDLGCGEGKLLKELAAATQFERIVGIDVTLARLDRAEKRLKLDRLDDRQRQRFELLQGSLLYADDRLKHFDAAALVEVIEHLEPENLALMTSILFGRTRPQTVVVTTPNADYNALFESLPAGEFRHGDHRFEWSREEFRAWAGSAAAAHGYEVRFEPIGPVDAELGAPTQAAIFERLQSDKGEQS
jgi:3' terminal RNA ribose 2'-O-methyltransferase Hen1